MKSHRKIPAFTLGEMIVVLIITSIVIGLAFSVLTLVQKDMTRIQYNFNNHTAINALEQALYIDFNRYGNIEYWDTDNTLRLSTEIETRVYKFTETSIIRDTDTFHIQIEKKQLFFNGNEVNQGIIDAIKLETSKTFQNQTLFLFKENDATPFMN